MRRLGSLSTGVGRRSFTPVQRSINAILDRINEATHQGSSAVDDEYETPLVWIVIRKGSVNTPIQLSTSRRHER